MPIQSGDVKLLKSAVMADVPEGGGAPTGITIADGVSNAIFPEVSELDRAGGRVNLRKSFVSVQTDDTDTYFGANVIVAEPPQDERVSVTLFSTEKTFDTREQAQVGAFSTVAVDNEWAGYLFVHEFGHHFAGLADEYYTSPVAYQPAERVFEPWEANVTALLDGQPLKWLDLVKPGTPLPTPWPKAEFEARQREFQARRKQIRAENRPESAMNALFREELAYTTRLFREQRHADAVGAFQGANYDAQAFYRSQLDCVMFTRNDVPFCRVCQRALEQVIDLYAGPRRSD